MQVMLGGVQRGRRTALGGSYIKMAADNVRMRRQNRKRSSRAPQEHLETKEPSTPPDTLPLCFRGSAEPWTLCFLSHPDLLAGQTLLEVCTNQTDQVFRQLFGGFRPAIGMSDVQPYVVF